MANDLMPDHIMAVAFGFWSAKTLLTAVELGVFTELAKEPMDAEELRNRLGLHPRSARDFFDALVAMRMLERQNDRYSNTAETDLFLDKAKPGYLGGLLEMANVRMYPHWCSFTEALHTGLPQNESKGGGATFADMYADRERMRIFLKSMTGHSIPPAKAMAAKFPWRDYRSLADIGTAEGGLPVQIALAHPHLTAIGFDLAPVAPVFEEYVDSFGLRDRVRFQSGDFFKDPLPRVDVLVFGHVLHNWNIQERGMLLAKAYEALPNKGAVIVYEALIDNERRENVFGLLMSLHMLIETKGGANFTGAECSEWMREAGFSDTRIEHLAGPEYMVVGIK